MQLFCTNEDSGHRVMLWYQQLPGHTALTLIGYGYGEMTNDSVEQPFKEHFRLTGDLTGNEEKNGSLSIFNLQALEHTATYFCAFSSPQHNITASALDKNLFPSCLRHWAEASIPR